MANYVLSESLKFDNILLMAENQVYRTFETVDRDMNRYSSYVNDDMFNEEAYLYLNEGEDEQKTSEETADGKKSNAVKEFLTKIWTIIKNFFEKLGKAIWEFIKNVGQWILRQIAKIKSKKEDKLINVPFRSSTLVSVVNEFRAEALNTIKDSHSALSAMTAVSSEYKESKIIEKLKKLDASENANIKENSLSFLNTCSKQIGIINGLNSECFKVLKSIQAEAKAAMGKDVSKEKVQVLSNSTKKVKNLIIAGNYSLSKKVRSAVNSVVKTILAKEAEPAPATIDAKNAGTGTPAAQMAANGSAIDAALAAANK